jgi:hypothetical protein
MLIGKVADQLAQMFGFSTYVASPAIGQDRIIADLNATIQELQDAGEDFYGRELALLTLVADQSIYVLDKNIQTVLKPVKRADGSLLTEITSRGGLSSFGQIFQDALSGSVSSGTPTHYFIESLRDTVVGESQGGDQPDSVTVQLHLRPAPDALSAGTGQLILSVIREPGIFTAQDLAAGTAFLSVPQKYVESIFLPIMRWNATGSYLFFDKDKKGQIDDDYMRALQLLGRADPRRPKPIDSKADALELRQTRQQGPPSPAQGI